jgi:hypothetical protein
MEQLCLLHPLDIGMYNNVDHTHVIAAAAAGQRTKHSHVVGNGLTMSASKLVTACVNVNVNDNAGS